LDRKTLILINPVNRYRRGFILRNESRQVPLGLGIVAALTPPEWKVVLLDENFKDFKYREAHLVGITAFTSTASRAYEIAKMYRDKGIPVVMGGIHASTMPEEALNYVDAVVIGEAESAWPQLLADFEAGTLKSVYKGPIPDFAKSPVPRHDLFHPAYFFASVQTSRGCPMDCDFCSVPGFNGHKYRLREVESILDELQNLPQKLIYFVDDNLIGYNKNAEDHAIALFKGMIARGLKKEWFAQVSLNIAEKPEVLKLAAQSGCRLLLIGIEAEKAEQLQDANKRLNLKLGTGSYAKAFRTIHRAGIAVLGAFIFGMESDTPKSLDDRASYIINSSVDVVQASVMTPLPGTRLFEKMKNENRIICHDFPLHWQHFHFSDVVFKPLKMSPKELANGVNRVYGRICSNKTIRLKFLRTLWNTKSLRTAIWAYNSNLNYQKVAFEKPSAYEYTRPE
jgi:radical SAM superfamily enzyme YgiQ (UPF0313 family)